MGVPGPLYSDSFTSQDYVAAIFYQDQIAGMCTLKSYDLGDQISLDDSYFKVWPLNVLNKFKIMNRHVLACCNLAITYEFRRNAMNVSWKDLLFVMVGHYLKESRYSAIVSTVRLEKGMEKCAYRTGAIPLMRGLPYTIPGQSIDIVCWYKNCENNNSDLKNLLHS